MMKHKPVMSFEAKGHKWTSGMRIGKRTVRFRQLPGGSIEYAWFGCRPKTYDGIWSKFCDTASNVVIAFPEWERRSGKEGR